MEHQPQLCLSCYVALLENSANFFGYTLRPIGERDTNLPPEYYPFFLELSKNCAQKIAEQNLESRPPIDLLSFQTCLLALRHELGKLFTIGVAPKTVDGQQKVITVMRGIRNLLSLINSMMVD